MSGPNEQLRNRRRARLARARVYLATDAKPPGRTLEELLTAALEGGVDIVQLRDRAAAEPELHAAGELFRTLSDRHDALFVVNDRPDLALACGADGVHVGQADQAVAEVRAEVGDDVLIGLSTHSAEQFDAGLDSSADYLSAGPVHATPTKPGRPAVGLGLIRHAAAVASKPWFAIGGLDRASAGAVFAAGAERIVVVRAIRDVDDPRAAAAGLRALAEEGVAVGAE